MEWLGQCDFTNGNGETSVVMAMAMEKSVWIKLWQRQFGDSSGNDKGNGNHVAAMANGEGSVVILMRMGIRVL